MSIHLDVYTRLDERGVRRDADKVEDAFDRAGDRAGRAFGENLSGGIERSAPKVEQSAQRMEKATDKVADAISRVKVEQAKYDEVQKKSDATDRQKIERSEALAKAKRAEAAAVRDATRIHEDHTRGLLGLSDTATSATASLASLGSTLGALGKVAGPVGLAVMAGGLVTVTGVAASAAQALMLLPGAATAAGAAFGTLKLATLGFGDALDSLGDREKFADALQDLSPQAQQAALSIQSLMPAFSQLKNATQDAFFNGLGQQINRLADTYLPIVQHATTGIADAFNTMISSVSGELMTPEVVASIQAVADNVVAAFQGLAPAIAPLTDAFTDLIAVGSDFLPDLARGASEAATAFAAFISDARESGKLHEWISAGLQTMGELKDIALDTGKAFMGFAEIGKTELPKVADAMKDLADNIGSVVKGLQIAHGVMQLLYDPGHGVQTLKDAFSSEPPTVTGSSDASVPTAPMSPNNPLTDIYGLTPPGAPSKAGVPAVPAGGFPVPGGGLGHGVGQAQGPVAGWSGIPLAALPGGGGASGPKLPDAPVLPYTPPHSTAPTASLVSAENSLYDAQFDVESKKARLAQLQSSNVATDRDIQDARNDVAKAEQDRTQAELRLNEARQTATQKGMKQLNSMTDQLGDIGAKLDQDFGLSKGLPGLAENLTKFIANLAAAPLLGQARQLQLVHQDRRRHRGRRDCTPEHGRPVRPGNGRQAR